VPRLLAVLPALGIAVKLDTPISTNDVEHAGSGSALQQYPWHRRLLARHLEAAAGPTVQIELFDGRVLLPCATSPIACVRFRNFAALFRTLRDPELNFGDEYSAGEIEVDRLEPFLEEAFAHSKNAPRRRHSLLPSRHSRRAARENIHHHYDIGNDFYHLWLDARMAYTCAYYARPDLTLEAAQIAKMDHVCRKLRLQPGERVVEAGCGWGALALHMASRFGVQVRAFNISHEQVAYARDWARREGLSGRVEFVEDDFRNIAGRFDAFVSIGMLEHVGIDNYRVLGEQIDRCLTPDGRGLIHTIGCHRPFQFNRWLQSRIFPGAEPPALSEMMTIFEPHDLAVLDVENLRLHYARTLHEWLARFEKVSERVREMFDERFVRAWRLYLASSEAAFATGWFQLFQVLFNRRTSNDVPMTRDHLYVPRP
jgi:cyclopropane-fatty-acyl-phospholipid synthase